MEVEKFDNIKIYQRAIEIQKIGNEAVNAVLKENREKGIPIVFSENGIIYYELPGGEITTVSPFTDNLEYLSEINNIVSSSIKIKKTELIKKVVSFESLKKNWDGYGAYPLEIESAANTINLINLFEENIIEQVDDVFPNPNGTITLVWKNNTDERISLEIGNQTFSFYVKLNSQPPIFLNDMEVNEKEAKNVSKFIKNLEK